MKRKGIELLKDIHLQKKNIKKRKQKEKKMQLNEQKYTNH